MMKKFQTNIFSTGKKPPSFFTWKEVAKPLLVPEAWLRDHCIKRFKAAAEAHNGFEFDGKSKKEYKV
jgi:hypothetical protein